MVATIDRRLSRLEAARRAGVSAELVDRWAKDGKLPYISTSLGKLYDPADVDRLVAERAARTRPAPSDDPQAA